MEIQDPSNPYKWRIIEFDIVKKYVLNNEVENIEKKNEELNDKISQCEEIFSNLNEDQQGELWDCIDEEWFVNKEITAKAKELKKDTKYDENSTEYVILQINQLIEQEKTLKKEIKKLEEELLKKIINTIEQLTDEKIIELLEYQRIDPIMDWVKDLFETTLNNFSKWLDNIREKYAITLTDLEKDIQKNWEDLSNMIDELNGNDFDIKWLNEFKSLLTE